MAIFESTLQPVKASAETVYDKLSDLENIKKLIGNIPESTIPADQKEMFDAVRVSDDSITFPAGPVGEVSLKVTGRFRPSLIQLEGVGTPVAISFSLNIFEVDDSMCNVKTTIDIAIPAMLKPMIGGTLEKMAQQFTEVISHLNYE